MYKLLIPLVAVLLGTATLLHAQVPVSASIAQPANNHSTPLKDSPESACTNLAGTFVLGAPGVNTQSNDLTLDTIFLCFGDSIFIDHNPDAVLTGDPDPSSTPGVGWAFYDCTPTVMGDNLQLVTADPCILVSPASGLPVLGVGNAEGDIWFFNSGFLQTTYNSGQPVLLHFAPITIDSFGVPPVYESVQVGAPPGPCVNVNTGVQFSVVYLNAITAAGISTNFNNDCLGKFRIKGGYPEWDPTARYTIDISLDGQPATKALIHTSPNQFFHGADIVFSVSVPGLYNIVVEDGKSCGFTFQMNMNGCNPVDNLVLSLPELTTPPGSQICVPITVENYNNIVSNSFSLQWDPTVLQYSGVHNYPVNTDSSAAVRNEQLINQGLLGLIVNTPSAAPIILPASNELLEVCFTVIGQLGDCTPLSIINLPTQIGIENQAGTQQAITADTGQVCVNFLPLTIVSQFIDTICPGPGNTTATLKVTASGGQPGYEVRWRRILPTVSPFTPPNNIPLNGGMYTASGITNGTYEIELTDDNGQGQILLDTIELNLQPIGASLTFTKLPACFGDSNGVITAMPLIGGTNAPDPSIFTYNWSPAAFNENSQTLDSLPGNVTYSVTVSDANGCTAVASGTLSQPSKLDDQNITITDAACTGVEDGTISLTMEGGTPFPGSQYQYHWEYSPTAGGTPGGIGDFLDNPSVLTQLPAGFYDVTVTDANGCTFVPASSYEVKNLRTISVNLATATNVKCFGSSDGALSINVTATPPFANPNFSFIWVPAAGTETSTATTSSLTGLPAGTYGVLATEASGCADTASFTITQPLKFVLDTAALSNPTCTNMNDGLIRVSTTGGTGFGNQIVYTWNPPAATNTFERTNLVPGTYRVTATDVNGCADSLTFVLQLPPSPVITQVDSTSVKCGSDGCLTVTSPTAVSYAWQDTSGATIASTAQACNLPGGTYFVQVTDANNCVTQDTLTLGAVDGLYFSDTTFTLPTCYGDSNGVISVGVMGGTTPYNYLWTPGNQTTGTLTQAKAGLYVLKVTDANSCVLADTFQLLDAPRIQYGLTNYLAATCADSCNGQTTLEVYYSFNGGVLPGNFTFLWDDGSTDSVRTTLCPGLHHVTITDANNCFTIGEVDMQAPDSITATLTTIPVTCHGGSDGSATVLGGGGNGQPFSYTWETNPTTPTVTGLAAGQYDVTVADKNKCKAVFTATITEPDSIGLTPEIDSILCFGENQGSLGVTIAGGNTGAYTYVWSDGTNQVGTTNPIEMLFAGTYSVTVTDAKGCTGVLNNIVLLDPPPVQGSIEAYEPLVCNGDETTLNIDTIFGGRGGPYQYSVDFGVTLNPDFPINVGGGEHFITYFDQKNCSFTDSLDIPEPEPIEVTFNPATVEIELGDSLVLEPVITGVTSLDSLTYVWTPIEGLLHLPSLMPTAYTFESQVYTLLVTDEDGCVGSGSIVVNVDPNRNVYLPNVFKPGNPRGLNDHFNPVIGRGVDRINFMQVYDRWGELMYERKDFFPNGDDFSEGWDGKYNGDFVNPGVFIYVVEARFLDGKVLLYRGDVTVVR